MTLQERCTVHSVHYVSYTYTRINYVFNVRFTPWRIIPPVLCFVIIHNFYFVGKVCYCVFGIQLG